MKIQSEKITFTKIYKRWTKHSMLYINIYKLVKYIFNYIPLNYTHIYPL